MMPAAFVIPRVDVMAEGTTAKTEHAVTVDVVVLHRQPNATEGLRESIILGGKCYDTIIADRSLGGKVRLVGGNRQSSLQSGYSQNLHLLKNVYRNALNL
jgi:hypothetical protein